MYHHSNQGAYILLSHLTQETGENDEEVFFFEGGMKENVRAPDGHSYVFKILKMIF